MVDNHGIIVGVLDQTVDDVELLGASIGITGVGLSRLAGDGGVVASGGHGSDICGNLSKIRK